MSAPKFEPIATAQSAKLGTVADLKMFDGRVIRCAMVERGNVTAWFPLIGPRQRPIGLVEPVGWCVVDNVTAIR
jgi:hypothetical protein